jgi:uncharacterized membrane protein YbhN (UPF0104 family)
MRDTRASGPEVAVTEEQGPVAPARRIVGDWVRLALLAVALAFGVVFVAGRWSELSDVISRLPWLNVAGSVLFGALGSFLSMLGWRSVLVDFGAELPVAAANRVFFLGQLGKYLPGSVWSFLAQADLARAQKVSRKAVLAGSVFGAALTVAVGLTLAVVFLPFGSHEALRRYWWVILAVPVFLAALHPRIAGAVIDRVLRLIRRQPLAERPSYAGTLRAGGWYALGWLALALHAWLLVVGLGAPAARALPVTIGGFALAYSIGILFVPAPAGAGVREVALTVALSPVLGPTEALAVALASRVILAILDFVQAGIGAIWAARVARPVGSVP